MKTNRTPRQIETEIRRHHNLGKRTLIEFAEHARAIGNLLTEAKALLRHGKFLRWATSKFNYSSQHIGWLMPTDERWHQVRPQIEDVSSVSAVMRSLAPRQASKVAHRQDRTPVANYPELRRAEIARSRPGIC